MTTIQEIADELRPFLTSLSSTRIASVVTIERDGVKWETYTNGHFLAARPCDDEHGSPDGYPNVGFIWDVIETQPLTHRADRGDYPPLTCECEDCDGSGVRTLFCVCDHCGDEHSADCNCTAGRIMQPGAAVVMGNVRVDAKYVGMLLDLSGADHVALGPLERLGPIRFEAGEWVGAIMPLNRELSTDEVHSEASRLQEVK